MNTIWKLMVFSIMLNFATGVMIEAVPIFKDSPTERGKLEYSATFGDNLTKGALNDTIASGSVMEDKGNLIYRVLDMMNIGYIFNFLKSVKQYMFGFVEVLRGIFGDAIMSQSTVLYHLIFDGLYGLILLGYMLGAFRLWTGKDITD